MARRDPLAGQSDFLPPTTDLNVLDRADAQPPDLALNLLQSQYLAKGLDGDAVNISDTLVPVAQIRPWVLDRAVRHEVQQPFYIPGAQGTVQGIHSDGRIVNPAAATVAGFTGDLPEGVYDVNCMIGGNADGEWELQVRNAGDVDQDLWPMWQQAFQETVITFALFMGELFDLHIESTVALTGTYRGTISWRRRFGPTITS